MSAARAAVSTWLQNECEAATCFIGLRSADDASDTQVHELDALAARLEPLVWATAGVCRLEGRPGLSTSLVDFADSLADAWHACSEEPGSVHSKLAAALKDWQQLPDESAQEWWRAATQVCPELGR